MEQASIHILSEKPKFQNIFWAIIDVMCFLKAENIFGSISQTTSNIGVGRKDSWVAEEHCERENAHLCTFHV